METRNKDYIYSHQMSLYGKREILGFGSKDWHIKEIEKKISKDIIIKNHYSHKVCNDATTHIHLGIFIKSELVGVLQFGYAMNPQSCDSVVDGTKIDQYKELNRMWLDDKAGRNSESKAISYSLKYIRAKFPKVKWIQSFADERCGGLGIVYQASNFSYYGTHKAIFWEFEGEIYHNSHITNNNRNSKKRLQARGFKEKAIKQELKQFRYLFFIDKRWREKCLLQEKEYPKHYNK